MTSSTPSTAEQKQQAILQAGMRGLSDAVNEAGRALAGLPPLHWTVDLSSGGVVGMKLVGHVSWGDYSTERGQEVAARWGRELGLPEAAPGEDGTRTWLGEQAGGAGWAPGFRRVEVWCVADRDKWDAATQRWAGEQR